MHQNSDVKVPAPPTRNERNPSKKSRPSLNYTVRHIRLRELIVIHRLYYSLSEESKATNRSILFGYPRSWRWFVAQPLLIISLTPLRSLLYRIYPKYLYYIIGAFDDQHRLIGCGHLVLHGYRNGALLSNIGYFILDKYQGMGIGTRLMTEVLRYAKILKVDRIEPTTLATNTAVIRLNEKFNFKISHIEKDAGTYHGTKCDMLHWVYEVPKDGKGEAE